MAENSIKLNYDKDIREYYAFWDLKVIGSGRTKKEVMEDLRTVAHFGVDTLINLKLNNRKHV